MVQHSTPRSTPAVDGCQECLRESRGDRVTSHDKRTCPEASTPACTVLFKLVGTVCTIGLMMLLLMYGFQSVFFEGTVVFPYKAARSTCGASLTYLLSCGQGLLGSRGHRGVLYWRTLPGGTRRCYLEFPPSGRQTTSVTKRTGVANQAWSQRDSTPAFDGVPNSSIFLRNQTSRSVCLATQRRVSRGFLTGKATWTAKRSSLFPSQFIYPWIIPRM